MVIPRILALNFVMMGIFWIVFAIIICDLSLRDY